jgi:hypothetical protein
MVIPVAFGLVDFPGYRAVPNPLKRYDFNDHSQLTKESDSSLKIAMDRSRRSSMSPRTSAVRA